jgi:acyloxyacyl hydrolase
MKDLFFKYIYIFLLFIMLINNLHWDHNDKEKLTLIYNSNGGGVECAACTVVISIIEQLTKFNEKSVEQILEEICDFFSLEFEEICNYFINNYGNIVIELLENEYTPDEVCHELKFCTDPKCQLFPSKNQKKNYFFKNQQINYFKNIIYKKQYNPWDWIKQLIDRLSKHKPIVDIDNDLFSDIHTLRGANWRGKDCNDIHSYIYPGRIDNGDYPYVDMNCNGIYGIDEKTGLSYEKLFCKDSENIGVIVLGDSAGAHFEIPSDYMTASHINKSTFRNLLDVLEMEFDWPHKSAFTGFVNSSLISPVDSIYKRLWKRNHCNHRDFQNLGVNGCRSGSMADNVVKSIARNITTDYPALVFFELIGNDVCNSKHSLSSMTTPTEFKKNILKSLYYLDTVLPKGSHIIFIGLANGLILWDSLHNRTHPIGATYEEVYNFLNCLQISPCWVWMNSNKTIREAGQKRANELSLIYPQIISNYKFKNFDMVYYDFPLKQIIEIWKKKGGETWQLIEPIDGFHPSQIANALIAEYFWETLSKEHPEFLGKENPHNLQIEKIFGDQGGY